MNFDLSLPTIFVAVAPNTVHTSKMMIVDVPDDQSFTRQTRFRFGSVEKGSWHRLFFHFFQKRLYSNFTRRGQMHRHDEDLKIDLLPLKKTVSYQQNFGLANKTLSPPTTKTSFLFLHQTENNIQTKPPQKTSFTFKPPTRTPKKNIEKKPNNDRHGLHWVTVPTPNFNPCAGFFCWTFLPPW